MSADELVEETSIPCTTPCACPIHDHVAELLGIVSTTGKDFRPEAAAARRAYPPRPRKLELTPRQVLNADVAMQAAETWQTRISRIQTEHRLK